MALQPMLAKNMELVFLEAIIKQFGVDLQPKYDGMRGWIKDGIAVTRKLIPIRNEYIQRLVKRHADILEGADGEFMVGDECDKKAIRKVGSVMKFEGEPEVKFFVYDKWDSTDKYEDRLAWTQKLAEQVDWVFAVPTIRCTSMEQLWEMEQKFLDDGYEGAIARHPEQTYKYGRSTAKSGHLLKIKRFVDAEAEVIGFLEKMHNGNEATKNAIGSTKRSSHKENKEPLGTLGSLIVRGVVEGKMREFKIGSGWDHPEAQEIWDNRKDYIGKLAKFKYFDIVKDSPRFSTFLAWRDEEDT